MMVSIILRRVILTIELHVYVAFGITTMCLLVHSEKTDPSFLTECIPEEMI